MKISVIIPTYMPQAYLWECLDSMAKQTLNATEFEVLIILNGCKEPFYTDIQEYIGTHLAHLHTHLIQTDQSGVSNARNIGLDKAQGEYITFIDDDDYVSPNYLESLLGKATHDTISLSNTIGFDNQATHIDYYVAQSYRRWVAQGRQPFYQPRSYMSGPCMKLIHRNIIGDTRFDTTFKNGEDSLFMFNISKNMQWVDFTADDVIYYRRFRKGSASRGRNIADKIHGAWQLCCAYSRIYWHSPKSYRFEFYITRLLGSIKSILVD